MFLNLWVMDTGLDADTGYIKPNCISFLSSMYLLTVISIEYRLN